MDRLLGEHGIQLDTPASRQAFERQMEKRRLDELEPEALEAFRREWCLGGEAFCQERCSEWKVGRGFIAHTTVPRHCWDITS